jgi:hypothetical protein
MAHVDLTASSSVSMASVGSPRTFTVLGGDATTKITFYNADASSAASGATLIDTRFVNRRNPLALRANETAQLADASSFIGYTLAGTAPTAVYVDGPGAGTANAAVATTSAAGTVVLTAAPGSATAPTVVSSTDPRVTTVNVVLALSSSDGSLAETPIAVPGVAGTISSVKLIAPAAITQSDTNYLTLALKIRDGAGGSSSSVASKSTQVTGGAAFLAFQAVSLGSLSNTTTTATSVLTFTSTKTSAGQAVAVPVILEIIITPTV